MLDLEGYTREVLSGQHVEYLDVREQLIDDFHNHAGLGTGLGAAEFHPDFAENGLFSTVHTEAGSPLADDVPDPGQTGDAGVAVTGGFVYRGEIPELRGRYLFTALVRGRVLATDVELVDGGGVEMRVADATCPGAGEALQTQQTSPDAASNDDWKAGVHDPDGVESLAALGGVEETTVMGWFEPTGLHPALSSGRRTPTTGTTRSAAPVC